MDDSQDEKFIRANALFVGDVQPWAHAYLDGLRTNLKTLRLQGREVIILSRTTFGRFG